MNLNRKYTHIALVAGLFLLLALMLPSATLAQAPAVAGMTPQHISIPHLDLFTTVEAVGQAADGTMDVPSVGENIAWYQPGYAPGENGHAALAGHYDWNSQPGPFYGLAELPVGSFIAIVGQKGRILVYRTISNVDYGYQSDISHLVFGPSERSRLSLITCEGNFLGEQDTYDQRRVVTAELIFDTAEGELHQ